MPKNILQNKVAVITGGGRGIGEAIALAYAREGCSIALVSRTQNELTAAAENIRKNSGVPVEIFAVDVSNETEVRLVVERAYAKFGHIDILVCAAGIIQPIGSVEECESVSWEQVIRVNLFGTMYMVKAVLPRMKELKRGAIITFSGGGEKPMPGFSAYASSKAAVVKFTEILAEEVGSFGITANAVAPGPVNTKIFEDILSTKKSHMTAKQWKELEERREKGGASMEKVCELALFLVSEAGRKISGKLLSAQWDDLEKITDNAEKLMGSDMYTMRRRT